MLSRYLIRILGVGAAFLKNRPIVGRWQPSHKEAKALVVAREDGFQLCPIAVLFELPVLPLPRLPRGIVAAWLNLRLVLGRRLRRDAKAHARAENCCFEQHRAIVLGLHAP
jgi:hypothetical protein